MGFGYAGVSLVTMLLASARSECKGQELVCCLRVRYWLNPIEDRGHGSWAMGHGIAGMFAGFD